MNSSRYQKSKTSGGRGATVGVEEFRALNTAIATKDISASAHIDREIQAAVRVLIPSSPRSCSLTLPVTTPLYSTTVSQTLRQPLRGNNLWITVLRLGDVQVMQ